MNNNGDAATAVADIDNRCDDGDGAAVAVDKAAAAAAPDNTTCSPDHLQVYDL